jgi:hypothetical protein
VRGQEFDHGGQREGFGEGPSISLKIFRKPGGGEAVSHFFISPAVFFQEVSLAGTSDPLSCKDDVTGFSDIVLELLSVTCILVRLVRARAVRVD